MKSMELSRTYLEGLTTEELIVLADRFDIEVPPDLAWSFIVETLLDINPVESSESVEHLDYLAQQEMLEEGALDDAESCDMAASGAAPLPEQYNISFVDILIRDPLWVYVFWEIKSHEKEAFETRNGFNGYYLKICPVEDSRKAFTVHVRSADTAWYVGIPDGESSYKVELCVSASKKEIVIASSGVFTMPALFDLAKKRGACASGASLNNADPFNPLHVLSGINDFTILRNRERIVQ
ncbi:MAG: DUF4912 domain-containing protein [Treponema sp.]|jgi:hypothetical protein|nr:DUF4912 domain-containing protein [Treponema sp.]